MHLFFFLSLPLYFLDDARASDAALRAFYLFDPRPEPEDGSWDFSEENSTIRSIARFSGVFEPTNLMKNLNPCSGEISRSEIGSSVA